ncbi:MAG: hypothetical protein Q8880_08940, partial [Bacteroidota bacterium]|nr:hypothetical protein [Bacteroidota bacterium]
MSENKQTYRLSKVAKELNVGISTITEFLTKKGYQITDISPNAKISEEIYNVLLDGFMSEKKVKEESQKIEIDALKKSVEPEPKKEEKKETFNEEEPEEREILIKGVNIEVPRETVKVPKEEPASVKIIGKIDLESLSKKPEHKEKTQAKEKVEKIEKLHKETVPEIKEEVKEILEKTTRKTTKVKIEEEPKEVIITEVIQPVQKIEVPEEIKQEEQLEIEPESKLKIVGKIDLDSINKKTKPEKKTAEEKKIERKEKKKKTGKKESIIEEKGIESEKI